MIFSALTFNMQNGQPWTGDPDAEPPMDLDRTIRFLRSADADLLVLQEVEQGIDGGEQKTPPPNFEILRAAFDGFESAFAYPPRNPDELPFGLGLAIFSRWPIEEVRQVVLPSSGWEFEFGGRKRKPSERILLMARVRTPQGGLWLMNTHLQAYFMIGTSSREFPGQRDRVLEVAQGLKGPVLIGGDFNCAPLEKLPQRFAEEGFRAAQDRLPTWKRRPYVVDHWFYNEGLEMHHAAVLATDCSDHNAVFAKFSLREELRS